MEMSDGFVDGAEIVAELRERFVALAGAVEHAELLGHRVQQPHRLLQLADAELYTERNGFGRGKNKKFKKISPLATMLKNFPKTLLISS